MGLRLSCASRLSRQSRESRLARYARQYRFTSAGSNRSSASIG